MNAAELREALGKWFWLLENGQERDVLEYLARNDPKVAHTIADAARTIALPILEADWPELRRLARQEWEANFNLERIERPKGWDTAIWLDYLAARTEYIVRQLGAISTPTPVEEL